MKDFSFEISNYNAKQPKLSAKNNFVRYAHKYNKRANRNNIVTHPMVIFIFFSAYRFWSDSL